MRSIKGMAANCLMHIFSLLPLQNKVVFCSFGGKNCGDNPGVIYQQFLKDHPELQYIWLMSNPNMFIEGATVVSSLSVKALYHLSTAKLWIDNSRKREWIVKRKKQFYVQTWHGDVCIKKIEKDAETELDAYYVQCAKHDSRITDLMLSGSRFRTELYKKSFWYDGRILEYGTPKSEVFYHDSAPITQYVKQTLGIPVDSRIVLYCPTFRNDGRLDVYDIDYEGLLEAIKARWPGRWYVLIRLHPKIQCLHNQIKYSDRIIDGSVYPFTNELIIASDLLISDYSGCLFAGLETQKRVLIYAPDLDEYVQKERGLYFDIRKLPFPFAKDNEDLQKNIRDFDEAQYFSDSRELYDQLGFMTKADTTKRIVEYIYSELIKKGNKCCNKQST